ncbi:AAA family ATPase [Lysobacter korlensis]|uniref:AAA family ATPase n=1 Tax=Lysobacter korlensis TaxID=553636 RepID=A0ABV6RXB0_9GAMM
MPIAKRKRPEYPGQVLESDAALEADAELPEDDHHGELIGGSDALATTLPESLRISVDLPPAVHDAPEDEAAVAIPDVPVDPVFLDSKPDTMSVPIIQPTVAAPEPTASLSTESSKPTHLAKPAHLAKSAESSKPAELSKPSDAVAVEAPAAAKTNRSPEPAAMLTPDRLLDRRKRARHAPEGAWQRFVYESTFRSVHLGDSRKARERKAIEARIDKVLEGGTRFVPVLTRKGGVGKTTITTLLGMALAHVREDRIIAIDANPDRGTLAERVNKQTRNTVRDVVTKASSVHNFSDFSMLVSRDETRLDVLASDTDPLLSEAFDENDYNVVADLCARYYSIALTDCGTGIVHSVMRATLQRADSIVIVSGGSVDEARLASETLTWLEANGYGDLVRNAIVAVNTATQGTNMVKLEEIEDHFRSRVRDIVRIPYDPQLAAGSVVNYQDLKPFTKEAARELAALVVDGLPSRRTA